MTSEPTLVLESQALAKHYSVSTGFLKPKALVRALAGVSFTLAAGRTLAVVGESGCGKSTLARQLTMIEPPTSGHLLLAGADVTQADAALRKQLRQRVQMVFQNPFASLNPRKKIGHVLEEPLAINTHATATQRRDRAAAMLARVGLRPEHIARYPHMFSGGQRQRIAIARALMLEPKIVVLDEPVSALDVTIQAQILDLIRRLQKELGMGVVMITHDLGVVAESCDRVVVMYAGRKVEEADVIDLFDRPLHPYTRALMASMPAMNTTSARLTEIPGLVPAAHELGRGCAFAARCTLARERCRTETPQLTQHGGDHVVACFAVEEQWAPTAHDSAEVTA